MRGSTALRTALDVPGGMAAIRLTLITSTLAALINAVMGTMLAYVLVRYSFRGRRALSAIVDLPLAIPTLVTGVMLVALYGPNSRSAGSSRISGSRSSSRRSRSCSRCSS